MERHMRTFAATIGILGLMTDVALAHPEGHDFAIVQSLLHLVTEPDHFAMLLAGVALAAGLIWRARRSA
jgi:hypothetical protein